MLTIAKNGIVTTVCKQEVEIRQMEIDWYCQNYASLAGQSAMVAGFAFSFLTTPMPEDHVPHFALEFAYLFLSAMTIGLELSALILSVALAAWGPSLALRGQCGASDLHKAVDCLRDYQDFVFAYFMLGWILYFFTAILQVWIYFRLKVAIVVTIPLSFFVMAILYFSVELCWSLKVSDRNAVSGRIQSIQPYEFVGDLDHGLHTDARPTGTSTYCPIIDQSKIAPNDYQRSMLQEAPSDAGPLPLLEPPPRPLTSVR